MDFLALVKDVARQSGTLAGGTTISSVTGLSGRGEKIANWVQSAWEDIQTVRDGWKWMYREFDSALLIDTKRYTNASFNIASLSRWAQDTDEHKPFTIYDPAIGQADEGPIYFLPYKAWRERYDRGVHEAMRPVCYSISPANEFVVGPRPDKAYVLRGEYWKGPQTLTLNGDVPEMPEKFHKAIVWRAMMLLGEADENDPTINNAGREYKARFAQLVVDQLANLTLEGNTLA